MDQAADLAIESNPVLGVILCLLAYLCVSFFGICEKLISHKVSVPTILFCQNILCLILVTPQLMKSGVQTLLTANWRLYIIRISAGLCCYASLFYLLRKIPTSEAFLYQYSASLWIPLVMLMWLGISIKKEVWYGIVIGFIGICFILKPNNAVIGFISIAGIVCSLSQAISVVSLRRLANIEPIARVLFYYFLTVALISGIVAFRHGIDIPSYDIKWLAGVGLFAFFAQQFLAMSLKYASAATLAPICYTTVLYSSFFDWIIWHTIPDRNTLWGMGLVILGCLITLGLSQRRVSVFNRLAPTE